MTLHLTKNVIILSSVLVLSCSTKNNESNVNSSPKQVASKITKPHPYGGWYCPDNLNGFPPVDYDSWKDVPVISDRLPTKEETKTASALIYVNLNSFPDAKAYDLDLPKLAQVYSPNTNRIEDIIIIQALTVKLDTIVGYRFFNGGNGSARLSEVTLLDDEASTNRNSKSFVSQTISVNASQKSVWQILEKAPQSKTLTDPTEKNPVMQVPYSADANLSFNPHPDAKKTASYADLLFGCYYIQNTYKDNAFAEKLLFFEDPETQTTTLKMVAGPYGKNIKSYENKINDWMQELKVKAENQ